MRPTTFSPWPRRAIATTVQVRVLEQGFVYRTARKAIRPPRYGISLALTQRPQNHGARRRHRKKPAHSAIISVLAEALRISRHQRETGLEESFADLTWSYAALETAVLHRQGTTIAPT